LVRTTSIAKGIVNARGAIAIAANLIIPEFEYYWYSPFIIKVNSFGERKQKMKSRPRIYPSPVELVIVIDID
jgi:hypothetical protein